MEKRPIVIVDAWNVVHRIPRLKKHLSGGPEAVKKGLIACAAEWLAKRSDIGQFWLVFDGGAPAFDEEPARGIRVIHSGANASADDRIVMLLERADRRRRYVVVSDDNELAGRCRQLGAETKSVGAFFETPTGGKSSPWRLAGGRRKEEEPKARLSPRTEKEINDALRQAWGIK